MSELGFRLMAVVFVVAAVMWAVLWAVLWVLDQLAGWLHRQRVKRDGRIT